MNTNLLTIASMIILLSIGIGIGWGFQTTVVASPAPTVTVTATQTSTVTQGSNSSEGPYVLTLILTTGNNFNSSVGDQPAYYVLTPHGLESSANIALPAGRLIELVIVNYDDGNATLESPQYADVQGTVNGTMTYANNDNVNSSQDAMGMMISGGQTVSAVPAAEIAHTFTIPALGINIPVPVSSTVTAYIKIDKAGTYTWFCETTCGSGATGLEGAMSTPGWMTGRVAVTESLLSPPVSTAPTAGTGSSAGPYMLTLVEIMGNVWNSSVGMQPRFFVLGSNGLESSASISLPAHRLIQVTILSYDTPTPNSTASEAKVMGTVGGKMYLINGTTASMTDASMAMSPWGANVTSVPVASLAHTFTVQSLGINIPVVGGSTEMAYLYFDQPGTYTWLCLTPCGAGQGGLAGAMDTPGWMTGTLVVS
jgi:plastocyanin